MATQNPGKQVLITALTLVGVCFQVALHAQQQMPKPIQDQSFARPLSSQSSNLRSVQAYERVGKQIFPSQPTGQTVLQRTRSPWIERFMKPRTSASESGPSHQHGPSVSGTQPPLQNSGSHTPAFARPQSQSGYDVASRYSQSRSTSASQQGRNQNFPAPSTSATRGSRTGQRAAANQRSTSNDATSESRLGIGSIPGFQQVPASRTAQNTATPQNTSNQSRSSGSLASRPGASNVTSTRTSRTQTSAGDSGASSTTEFARTLTQEAAPENEAPRVSRVPLPRRTTTSSRATKPTESKDKVASVSEEPASPLDKPQDVAKTTATASEVATLSKTPTSIPEKPSVAPEAATGGTVSVPTRLVNTPKSKSAAFDEANSRPPALYLATQIQKSKTPVDESKTKQLQAEVAAKAEAESLELSLPKIPELPAATKVPPKDSIEVDTSKLALPKITPPPVEQPAAMATPKMALPKPESTNSVPDASAKVAEVKSPSTSAKVATATESATQSVPSLELSQPSLPAETPVEPKAENLAATETSAPISPTKPKASPVEAAPTQATAKRMPPVSREQSAVVASNEAVRVADDSNRAAAQQANAPSAANVVSNSGHTTRTTLAAQSMARFGTGSRGLYHRAENERIHTQAPNVRVVLNGPTNVPVGAPAEYEIQVLNEDQIDLEGLLLRVEVPAGVAVQPGRPEQGQFELETTPSGSTMVTWGIQQVPGGRIVKAPIRMASRQAQDFNIGIEWTLIPITRSTSVHVISPQVELAIVGPKEVNYGETNIYRVRVRNHGDAVAENVVLQVAAKDHGTSTSEVGNIAPGSEETMEIELQFDKRGKIGVNAVANAANASASKTGMDVLVRKAELVSQLTAPQMVYHGTAVSYVATVMNTGDAIASGVQGVLKLPRGARPASLPYGSVLTGSDLKWTVDRLAPNEQKEFRFQIDLAQEGENPVGIHFAANSGETSQSSAATLVQAIADLKLLVSDPVAPAPVGSEVVYELNLTNRGSKAAHNVRVVAQFSKGIEPTRSGGHGYRVVPGQVFFDPIGTVAAGQTVKLQIFALAETDGMHRFRAEVRTDDESIRLVQEESTQYLDTQMRIASPPIPAATLR